MRTRLALPIQIVLALPLLLMTGCASIISGRYQQVTFQSNPDGALITVNGRELGKTPMTTPLKRRAAQPLTFSKEGYKDVSMEMDSGLNPWFWGNIVIGGVWGSTTDGLTGAAHKYAPSQYMVTLIPLGTPPLADQTALSEKQEAKQFIVVGYKGIVEDAARGDGAYLTSLLHMLKVPAEQKSDAAKKILALSKEFPDIPEFANRVIDAYLK